MAKVKTQFVCSECGSVSSRWTGQCADCKAWNTMVETVPEALLAQLKDGGRIAALMMQGGVGAVKIGHKTGGKVAWRFVFNAAAPVMMGFTKRHEFAL